MATASFDGEVRNIQREFFAGVFGKIFVDGRINKFCRLRQIHEIVSPLNISKVHVVYVHLHADLV